MGSNAYLCILFVKSNSYFKKIVKAFCKKGTINNLRKNFLQFSKLKKNS